MTPNQRWRFSLLYTVLTAGPQPIELSFFHQHTSDIDSKKWLLESGLESQVIRVAVGPWWVNKSLTFLLVSEKELDEHAHPQLR